MTDPVIVIERALAALRGHYGLAEWAAHTSDIQHAVPSLIAEVKKYREQHHETKSS